MSGVRTATAVAKRPDRGPAKTYDAWMAEGRELAKHGKSLGWAVGDWWANGIHTHTASGRRRRLSCSMAPTPCRP
jgi:hypothetical protein